MLSKLFTSSFSELVNSKATRFFWHQIESILCPRWWLCLFLDYTIFSENVLPAISASLRCFFSHSFHFCSMSSGTRGTHFDVRLLTFLLAASLHPQWRIELLYSSFFVLLSTCYSISPTVRWWREGQCRVQLQSFVASWSSARIRRPTVHIAAKASVR